jgi:hypothetical protein
MARPYHKITVRTGRRLLTNAQSLHLLVTELHCEGYSMEAARVESAANLLATSGDNLVLALVALD